MSNEPIQLTATKKFRDYWNERLRSLYVELELAYESGDEDEVKRLEQEIAVIYADYPSYAKKLRAGKSVPKECHTCQTCIDSICTSRCID